MEESLGLLNYSLACEDDFWQKWMENNLRLESAMLGKQRRGRKHP